MGKKEEDAVRELAVDFSKAVNSGDAESVAGFLDPHARVFAPGIPVLHGRSEILRDMGRWSSHWKHDLLVVCDEVVVDTDWAFCSGTFGLRSVRLGSSDTHYRDGKFLAVVRNAESGVWRLYRLCHNENLPGFE